MAFDELADRIHDVLQEHFKLTSREPTAYEYVLAMEGLWERPGYPVVDVIADIAGLSEEVAADLVADLSPEFDTACAHDTDIP